MLSYALSLDPSALTCSMPSPHPLLEMTPPLNAHVRKQ